jgi:hypothetical protein
MQVYIVLIQKPCAKTQFKSDFTNPEVADLSAEARQAKEV